MESGLTLNQLIGVLQSAGVLGLMAMVIWSGKHGWWGWTRDFDQRLQLQAKLTEAEARHTDAESRRADRAETERDRLHSVIEERVIPALDAANHSQAEARSAVEKMAKQVESMSRQNAELRGRRS